MDPKTSENYLNMDSKTDGKIMKITLEHNDVGPCGTHVVPVSGSSENPTSRKEGGGGLTRGQDSALTR